MDRQKPCIVIADGEHARFVVPAPKRAFHTRKSVDSETAHRKSSDLGSDRPPRTMESATGIGHAIEPKHDLHDLAKEKFARRVAREVNDTFAQGGFEGLVLVAPPETANEIQDSLDAAAAVRLVGVLRKDLVKVPDHELAPHLEEWALRD